MLAKKIYMVQCKPDNYPDSKMMELAKELIVLDGKYSVVAFVA
jgi:hypothetical protein